MMLVEGKVLDADLNLLSRCLLGRVGLGERLQQWVLHGVGLSSHHAFTDRTQGDTVVIMVIEL